MKSVCTLCGTETDFIHDRPCHHCAQPKPAVGMGVTFACWTDRYAGTIIEVSASGKTIKVQQDIATRIDDNGHTSETQAYRYERNPNGEILTFRVTTRGKHRAWRCNGYIATIGIRREYRDPHF